MVSVLIMGELAMGQEISNQISAQWESEFLTFRVTVQHTNHPIEHPKHNYTTKIV